MIDSTLIEQKQLRCFYFHPLKQDCFRLKGSCQQQGNAIKQISLNKPAARCQHVVGKRLSIQNNRISMDENRKNGFYPDQPIISSQRPYRTGQIYGVYILKNGA